MKNTRAPRLGSGDAIREAAAVLFLESGYQGTSMDDVAAAAGVSKQTIYTHFPSKEKLFSDLVLGNVGRVDEFRATMSKALREAPSLEAGLRGLASVYIRFVIRPEVLRLRRLVIGEAGRFPELAHTYYEQVPERVYGALSDLFTELRDEGRLRLDDPLLAAHHFAWLALGQPLDRGMFLDPATASREVDVDGLAGAATAVFLAAYAAPEAAA